MEITNAVKLQIIDQEITNNNQMRYLLEIRHRVNKKLGHTPEQLKPLEDDLVKTENALNELEKVKSELSVAEKPKR